MPAPLATDYALARNAAAALATGDLGLAAVFVGGVGDDWLRQPVYPYAIVAPSEAQNERGAVSRTVHVRLAVRADAAASKPAPEEIGWGAWRFADGLLEAMQAYAATLPDYATLAHDSHIEIRDGYDTGLFIVGDNDPQLGFPFASVNIADGAAIMVGGIPAALAVVPVGSPAATRTPVVLFRVGAGEALSALVAAARDALTEAQNLGAPLESIATTYDDESVAPVAAATLALNFADPQAYGDAF